MRKIYHLWLFLFVFYPLFINAQNFWQQTNGPCGGDVRALIANINGDILAGTWGAGIFRSTDNGDSWVPVNEGLATRYINVFAIHPNGMIFAGAHSEDGIYFSTDNGSSWNHTLPGISVVSLMINSGGDIFAGTNAFQNNGLGLYRSTDNGQTWIPITAGLPSWINILSFGIQSAGDIYLGSNYGTYKSTDNGDNWQQVFSIGSTKTLAIDSNDVIFAGTGHGIYRSTDNGDTWVLSNQGIPDDAIRSITVNSANTIFAGTDSEGMFRSDDHGDSWTSINNDLFHDNIWKIAINIQDHIFIGTFGGGIYRSLNNGQNWTQTNKGLINSDILSLAPYSNNTIFSGTRENSLFYSNDQGKTWIRIDSLGLRIKAIAANSRGDIFIGVLWEGILKSIDGGISWTPVNNGLPATVIENSASEIFITPNDDIFLATTDGIYRSTNEGESWVQVGFPFTIINSFAINSEGDIYVGMDSEYSPFKGVYKSTDNGNSWVDIGLNFVRISTVRVNSQNHVFAGTYFNGIYRSMDNGSTWQAVNNGINYTWITTITINSSDVLFAGTWFGGVYKSENNGDLWNQINSGLTQETVFSLAIDSQGYIFAGTDNGGVFVSREPTTAIHSFDNKIPTTYRLEQNYPNPFNSETTIEFSTSRKEKIIIEIFNVLGQKVKTLLNTEITPGQHRLRFDASDLPSGLYIYRLKAPGTSLTQKMVLLR